MFERDVESHACECQAECQDVHIESGPCEQGQEKPHNWMTGPKGRGYMRSCALHEILPILSLTLLLTPY